MSDPPDSSNYSGLSCIPMSFYALIDCVGVLALCSLGVIFHSAQFYSKGTGVSLAKPSAFRLEPYIFSNTTPFLKIMKTLWFG